MRKRICLKYSSIVAHSKFSLYFDTRNEVPPCQHSSGHRRCLQPRHTPDRKFERSDSKFCPSHIVYICALRGPHLYSFFDPCCFLRKAKLSVVAVFTVLHTVVSSRTASVASVNSYCSSRRRLLGQRAVHSYIGLLRRPLGSLISRRRATSRYEAFPKPF